MKTTLKNFTIKTIKGEIAMGAYSHQKNNIKYYVVVYNEKQYFGTDLETIFNSL